MHNRPEFATIEEVRTHGCRGIYTLPYVHKYIDTIYTRTLILANAYTHVYTVYTYTYTPFV